MNPINAIARSGINAATLRLQAAASNIANMRSRGAAQGSAGPDVYQPLDLHVTAQAGGGVTASLAPSSRAALLTYEPQAPFANADGYVATPDVDVVGEMLQLATARYGLAANLSVIHTADEMTRAVLAMRA